MTQTVCNNWRENRNNAWTRRLFIHMNVILMKFWTGLALSDPAAVPFPFTAGGSFNKWGGSERRRLSECRADRTVGAHTTTALILGKVQLASPLQPHGTGEFPQRQRRKHLGEWIRTYCICFCVKLSWEWMNPHWVLLGSVWINAQSRRSF